VLFKKLAFVYRSFNLEVHSVAVDVKVVENYFREKGHPGVRVDVGDVAKAWEK
jgi:hypothetical protein